MATFSEIGHAKNIANFQDLIAFVESYGSIYNPSKNALKLPQLNALVTLSQTHLEEVITKNTIYNNAVNERIIEFANLKGLSTRIINALETTDATKEKVNNAKTFNRKLQGKRASQTTTAADTNAPAPNTISASQQSYDQQIQHLTGLIAVLQTEASYTPNETDLTIASLSAKQANLNAKNNAVSVAYANVSNSRITRNNTLYNNETSLVQTATEVKKYIKSIFGATSQEYAQVKGIQFKKIKM
ncbi:hypothetical protein GCM10022386_05880 [Flavobacterium cheonhonense]|uniref:Uncharacterized protein n=1 Tax=Flavobacterium cheonhonense TaxID=706185 RepID=A0ABP7TFF2_9FLAO|nr:hypothetical protein [Flavobacterium cheonhonense]